MLNEEQRKKGDAWVRSNTFQFLIYWINMHDLWDDLYEEYKKRRGI